MGNPTTGMINKAKIEGLGIEIEENLSIDQLENALKKLFVSDNDVFIWRNKATEKFTVVTPWVKFNEKYFQDIMGLDHAAPGDLGISRDEYIKSAMKNVREGLKGMKLTKAQSASKNHTSTILTRETSKFGWIVQFELETDFNKDDFNTLDEYIELSDYADFYHDAETGVSIGFFINIPWAAFEVYKNLNVTCNLYLFYPYAGVKYDKALVDRAVKAIDDRFRNRILDKLKEYGKH